MIDSIFGEHVKRLHDAINEFYDEKYSSGREKKLKRMAMAICRAENGDPEKMTMGTPGYEWERVIPGISGITSHGHQEMKPLWVHYVRQASFALDALEADE